MRVQKRYPMVPYKLHIELTEEEADRIVGELGEVQVYRTSGNTYPPCPS